MKALVTGANGQVGKALVRAAPAGWHCVATDRTTLDLTDQDAILRLVDELAPDLVINAAAYTAVDRAESEPELAHAVNAAAPAAFAKALKGTSSTLIQISTDFVFDGQSAHGYRPDDPRNPLSVYGASKCAGEDAAGPDAIIVRTSWVHAAQGSNFVRTMLRLMRERPALRVVADQIGAPTWAPGLAGVLWQLAQKRAPGMYHHRDAGVASWYDFAFAIAHEAVACGLLERTPAITPITTPDYPTPARRPAFSLLDVTETRQLDNLKLMLQEELCLG